MSKSLTAKQVSVLAAIRAFIKEHGYSPTRKEIASHFGWKSATAAQGHLLGLARKGKIKLDERAHRNIVIL